MKKLVSLVLVSVFVLGLMGTSFAKLQTLSVTAQSSAPLLGAGHQSVKTVDPMGADGDEEKQDSNRRRLPAYDETKWPTSSQARAAYLKWSKMREQVNGSL